MDEIFKNISDLDLGKALKAYLDESGWVEGFTKTQTKAIEAFLTDLKLAVDNGILD